MKEYIERNALIAELEYDLVNDVNMYNLSTEKEIRDDKYAFAIEVLDEAPEADVREVIHAKWINAYPDIEPNPMFMYGICSNCGFEQSVSDTLKYCPECGAQMDLKQESLIMDNNEIRVPVNGGCLVAGRNPDPDYDGIYIVFETDEGDVVDVVLTECKAESNKSKVDVYCYEDVYNEDFTRKYTLDNKEIYKALNG